MRKACEVAWVPTRHGWYGIRRVSDGLWWHTPCFWASDVNTAFISHHEIVRCLCKVLNAREKKRAKGADND